MRDPYEDEQTEDPVSTSAAAPRRLTRKLVADRLGVSIFKVRSMEGRELHPVRENGVNYFEPDDVARALRSLGPRRRRPGRERTDAEVAALAFKAFEEGRDLREIVVDLTLAPERVRALYREWREPDLEQHEIARRKRARAEAERRREQEELRQHEREMARWEREMARLRK
jgi:hypothetical protein